MQGFNAILIYNNSGSEILFCHRVSDPYKGKYNFAGGNSYPRAGEKQVEKVLGICISDK